MRKWLMRAARPPFGAAAVHVPISASAADWDISNERNPRNGKSLLICVAAISAMLPHLAAAADCTQANAIYADRDGAYELKFVPLNSQSAAASNQFKMSALKTSVVMDGYVMPSEDPVRAEGILMFHCPEGDATGADLDACTIWQGEVYAINAAGDPDNLQPESAGAADKIMLPGLGPAIRQSSVWGQGKATVAPWDVLTFKGCAK